MTPTANKKIPLLDLNAIHNPIREELLGAVAKVIDTGIFIMGDEVKSLEKEVAAYCDVKHAIACASGSDALYLALLGAGVQHGDLVLTTPFSFFATAGSISRVGATPVFVDIDPVTYNIDPQRLADALKANPRAKAIIPVHLYGGCADMDPILEIAATRGCVVIEDGAQSIGSEYKNRKAQGIAPLGCLSFFPSKNLGCFGDGGMVTSRDDAFAQKISALRVHGGLKKYYHDWIGTNSRLDAMQAAILRIKLRHLDNWSAARQKNAATYRQILGGRNLPITLAQEAPYQTRHIYNQFVIRAARRDELMAFLKERGVATEIYYPLPLHLQKCYQDLGHREGDMPESEKAAKEVLALPVYPGLAEDSIAYVCDLIEQFYGVN